MSLTSGLRLHHESLYIRNEQDIQLLRNDKWKLLKSALTTTAANKKKKKKNREKKPTEIKLC